MKQSLQGIYALWKREVIRFFRNKSRFVGSLGMPFFFLAILGTGLNNIFNAPIQGSYLEFITPGIISMVLMFGSVSSGILVLMDRQFGFLKETLASPMSRTAIVFGKALGGSTTALVQGTIIMIVSLFLGVQIQIFNIFLLFGFMVLISIMFVSLGTAIASVMEDMHGFQLIMNFLIMPLFFLSGALFPLKSAPQFLRSLSYLDPLTYAVNGLRFLLLGSSEIDFLLSLSVLLVFTIIFMGAAVFLFKRIEE